MSDMPVDPDLREQIARIDRALAETHKFQAETNNLQEEAQNPPPNRSARAGS